MEIAAIKGAPGDYRIGEGVLQELPALLKSLNISKYHIMSGKTAWEKASPFLPEEVLEAVSSSLTFIEGHCTLPAAKAIAERAALQSAEAIIGIGGGTALDTAKAAAAELGVKVILIPTIAATCAAWAPLSVFYDESGSFTHFTEFPEANTAVLVEPAIIAGAPVRFLKAGIADTLAKYYEARVLIASFYKDGRLPVRLQISQRAAEICRDVLLEDSKEAIEAAADGRVTESLICVAETIFMAGGMVGGFGGKAGRVAAAHSIHNGLTESEQARKLLHGELVAYGLLVQLALEKDWKELGKIVGYYSEWGLPKALNDFSIDFSDHQLVRKIIQKATLPQESIHYMAGSTTEEAVLIAMEKVEHFQGTAAVHN